MRRLPQPCQAAISAFPRALTQLCLWQPRNHREGSARLCRLPTCPVGPAPEDSLSCCVLHCLLQEISPTPCIRSSLSFPPADDWPSRAGTAILWEAMAVLATPAGPTAVQGDSPGASGHGTGESPAGCCSTFPPYLGAAQRCFDLPAPKAPGKLHTGRKSSGSRLFCRILRQRNARSSKDPRDPFRGFLLPAPVLNVPRLHWAASLRHRHSNPPRGSLKQCKNTCFKEKPILWVT